MQFSTSLVKQIAASDFYKTTCTTRRLALDNTTFSTWNSCFTKGLYYGALRKVSARPRTPLIFGASLHLGLKALLLGESLDQAIAIALADAAEHNLDSCCDERRNSETLELLIRSYVDHLNIMPNERLIPLEVDGVKIVEKEFSLKLGTIYDNQNEPLEVYWNGIVDLVGYYFNNLWVIDHKTTSIMGAKFADDKYRSSQMLGYFWVMSTLLAQSGIARKLKGAMINTLCLRKEGFEFKQFDLPYTQDKALEWQAETLENIGNIWRSLDRFVQAADFDINNGQLTQFFSARCNRDLCVAKYGRCEYFDLCETPATMRERLLSDEAFFATTTWNPGEGE